MKKTLLIVALLLCIQSVNSQVLISLVFGDKLNSPRVEFGLDGGVNFSTISNLDGAKSISNFNLGFYFDYHLNNPSWMFNTGVIVKSSMGSKGLAVYSLNNENLDNAFLGGSVHRKLEYFNVPLMMKYKFDNNIYVKAGTQLGLLYKAFDEFKNNYGGEDLEYKNKIKDEVHTVDAGLAVGMGYRLMGGNGMNLGVNYYHGLVTVMKGDSNPKQYNRSFYITVGIPIGKGKAAKRAAEKKTSENDAKSIAK